MITDDINPAIDVFNNSSVHYKSWVFKVSLFFIKIILQISETFLLHWDKGSYRVTTLKFIISLF